MSQGTGETTVIRRPTFVPGGRTVATGRGWDWIAEGWQVFKRAPGLWIGMIVVLLLIYIAMALIPFVGIVAVSVLGPVLAGGLMITSAKIDYGETPQFSDLFAGFKMQFGKLATFGALYLASSVVILVVMVLIAGVGVLSMGHGAQPDPAVATTLLAVLVAVALSVPVAMAGWFAVPLVLFHEHGAVDAVIGSFKGCLRNIVPFLLYGVAGFVLAILASIPFGLGWLVLMPVFAASVYTGYKDIFLSQ